MIFLTDIRVRDALKKEVLLIFEGTDVEKLNEIMLLKQQEEALVVDGKQKIVGIITRNDLAKSLARGIDRKTQVKSIMTPNVIFMPPDELLYEAKAKMRKLGISRAPVVDEEGNLLGLLTSKSICDSISRRLGKAMKFQELVLNNVKTAICILDDKCEILYYNKAFEDMFSPSRLIKLAPSNFLPAPLVDRIKRGEHPLEDIYFEGKDNRKFTIKTCQFNLDEELSGVILSIEEISNVVSLLTELDKVSYKLSFLEKERTKNDKEYIFGKLVSKNPEMITAIETAKKVAPSTAPVLIRGESGTGKEMMAEAIHDNSDRRNFPLIKIKCATIPANIFESELFGWEGSGFDSKSKYGKTGLLELADKSTIFIDEIDKMPLEVQAKIVTFLQNGVFSRLNDKKELHADVRIIAASEKDLLTLVKEGRFREDLYYCISSVTIEIPPLRKRCEDIVCLIKNFISEYESCYNKKIEHIEPNVMKILMDHGWPGNVRELKNVVERMVILCESGIITEDILPSYLKQNYTPLDAPYDINDLNKAADIAEKRVIMETLKKYAYNKTKVAQALKISRSTLYNKMKEYNLK